MNKSKNNSDMNIVHFYNTKINEIMNSFFIKYFIKSRDSYDKQKDFQMSLKNYDNETIGIVMERFKSYIKEKYNLSNDDLVTAIHIYIKESLQQLLGKKIVYVKSADLVKKLFYKCFKNISCDLYDKISMIKNTYEFKVIIENTIYHTVYDMIPFDYTIQNYNNEEYNVLTHESKSDQDTTSDLVKEHFYSHSSKQAKSD